MVQHVDDWLGRFCDILDWLSSVRTFTMPEMIREFRISKSTQQRYANLFIQKGFIQKTDEKLQVGPGRPKDVWKSLRYKTRPIEVFRKAVMEVLNGDQAHNQSERPWEDEGDRADCAEGNY